VGMHPYGPCAPGVGCNRPSDAVDRQHVVSATDDIPLRRVAAWVCDLCLAGEGGECHAPGCAFWLRDAPTGQELKTLRQWRAHTVILGDAEGRDLRFALAACARLTATRDELFETRRRLESENERLRAELSERSAS
jgi:hypothetical protein